MNTRKNILFFFLLLAAMRLMAQSPILYFVDSGSVHLRWNGIHTLGLEGYKVYRQLAGEKNWVDISGTIKPVYKYQELKKILKYKTGAYLQLYGVSDSGENDISNAALLATFSDAKSVSFLGLMSLLNPEFAVAMGEIYEDRSIQRNQTYEYKITSIENGAEKDLVKSSPINCSKISIVPMIKDLKATALNASVQLNWKREADLLKAGTIVTYAVFRSSDILGPYNKENFYGFIPITVISDNAAANNSLEQYKISFLENGKNYFFTVKAVNAFGIESAAAPAVECIPIDNDRSAPTGLIIIPSGKNAKLSWNESIEVEIFRSRNNEGFVKVYPPVTTTLKPIKLWYDNYVEEGNQYRYFIRAIRNNASGNSSDTVKWFNPDITPPSPPSNVRIESKKGLIILQWDANKEKDIMGYEIERASDLSLKTRYFLTSKPITQTIFRDSLDYRSQTLFGYIVYAVDKQYNRSKPSGMVSIKMPDFDPPSTPYIATLKETDAGVELTWESRKEPDIAKYNIYRATKWQKIFARVGESRITSFIDAVKDSGTYLYAVTAVDSAGNESLKSAPQEIIAFADKGKMIPVNGSIEQKEKRIILRWANAPGAKPDGFVVTRIDPSGKMHDIAQLSSSSFEYTDPYPVNGKLVYEIRSRNVKWQMGKPLKLQIEYKP